MEKSRAGTTRRRLGGLAAATMRHARQERQADMSATSDESKGNRWLRSDGRRGDDYDVRFDQLEREGIDVHGEAAFVESLAPRSVLDAGCGTGRVAIELDRRGVDVVGVDLDPSMLEAARRKAPHLPWVEGDLISVDVGRTFDVVVMAGNVMIFLEAGTEAAVVANVARRVRPGGHLVAGFQLQPGRLAIDRYDEMCAAVGLVLSQRWATWDRQPWSAGGEYAVSVHRRPAS